MKAVVKKIVGEKDASFAGQDGTMITGKTITCVVDVDGKVGNMPITAYGKLAEKISPGAELNVTKRVDKQGNSIFTAKKDDNMHLLPDAKPWTGGKGGGGGMSEDDILFIAACCLLAGDPSAYPQALEEAKALRALGTGGSASGGTTDFSESQDDGGDIPF